MGAAEFIDQLFAFLRLNITTRSLGTGSLVPADTISDINLNPVCVRRVRDLAGRWLAHDVGDVVVWCSSADSPEKILAFVQSLLSALACPAVEYLEEGRGKDGEKGGSVVSGVSAKKGTRGLMGRYASAAATIALCSRLLSPLLGDLSTESEVVRGVVALMSKACLCVLALCGGQTADKGGMGRGVKGQEAKGKAAVAVTCDQLLGPVIAALCMRSYVSTSSTPSSSAATDAVAMTAASDAPTVEISAPASTASAVSAVSLEQEMDTAALSYFMLKSFLAEVEAHWEGMSVLQRVNVQDSLTLISCISSSEEAVTMRLVCCKELDRTLAFIASYK